MKKVIFELVTGCLLCLSTMFSSCEKVEGTIGNPGNIEVTNLTTGEINVFSMRGFETFVTPVNESDNIVRVSNGDEIEVKYIPSNKFWDEEHSKPMWTVSPVSKATLKNTEDNRRIYFISGINNEDRIILSVVLSGDYILDNDGGNSHYVVSSKCDIILLAK